MWGVLFTVPLCLGAYGIVNQSKGILAAAGVLTVFALMFACCAYSGDLEE